MTSEARKTVLAAVPPLLLLFVLYMLKIMETGMSWRLTWMGVCPMRTRGLLGILTHPLVHADFSHLFANTLPLFFLSWCLFYFYRQLAYYIYGVLWLGCGALTFFFGQPGWHIGASGLIYGLVFFLFFSGLLRKHVPLIAISLLVTFLYGSIVWSMFPQFAKAGVSWEGHLSGAIAGTLCSVFFLRHGPQRPDPFADEEEEEEEGEEETEETEEENGKAENGNGEERGNGEEGTDGPDNRQPSPLWQPPSATKDT